MEFSIPQSTLSAALARATAVAVRRSTAPLLECVLLRVRGGAVTFAATDMTVSLVETLTENDGVEATGDGAIAIRARHLATMARVLPDGDVRVRTIDNSRAQITAGRTDYRVMGMPEGDFPELPDPAGVKLTEVASHKLVDLIDKTLFSVSTDEARVNLNGALFESNGKTGTMVSTDGHRLTKYSVALDGPKLGNGIIIPRKGMDEIRKVLNRVEGTCRIGVGDQYLFVQADALMLSVKLNNVTFPPWQQVVPKTHDTKATVNRADLLTALRQALVIAPPSTSTTEIKVTPDTMVLRASNPELGSVKLELPAEWDGDGELSIGVNGSYLIDALASIETERVELRLQSNLDPIAGAPVAGDDPAADLVAVVMPMRI